MENGDKNHLENLKEEIEEFLKDQNSLTLLDFLNQEIDVTESAGYKMPIGEFEQLLKNENLQSHHSLFVKAFNENK